MTLQKIRIGSVLLILLIVIELMTACYPESQATQTGFVATTLPAMITSSATIAKDTISTKIPLVLTPSPTITGSAKTSVLTITVPTLTLIPTVTSTPVRKMPPEGTLVFLHKSSQYPMMKNGVYLLQFPDGKPINLTSQLESFAIQIHPSWSPDGKWIVFAADDIGYGIMGKFDLYIVGADGNGLHRLTFGGYSSDPDWSPDGKWIAFSANNKIFRIHPDGSGAEALPQTSGRNFMPVWSPNGQYLAYLSGSDLWMLEMITGRSYRIVSLVGGNEMYGGFTWSPDSRYIYYPDLWDCGHIYRVENKAETKGEILAFPSGKVLSLSWSPDGKWISYIISKGKTCELSWTGSELYIAPADGSYTIQILDSEVFDPVQPVWKPIN